MSSLAQVNIHASQFPEQVRGDLLESLRTGKVNHKFHYDSYKQTRQWLALHQAYSPSRTDPDCGAIYDRAWEQVVAAMEAGRVQVIGLGCGGGQKDTQLLARLRASGKEVLYAPIDVSAAMVLEARRTARQALPDLKCLPLVCDLGRVEDWAAVLEEHLGVETAEPGRNTARLFTFLGMLPNFESGVILPKLASVVGRADCLVLSANLAPGPDYSAGVQRVLPLYDNEMTRDWLITFLRDLGVEGEDGTIQFQLENDLQNPELQRIAAYFRFSRPQQIRVEDKTFTFTPGQGIRLFFSYRHTPKLVDALLGEQGLRVQDQWVTRSGEEGVFLVKRQVG